MDENFIGHGIGKFLHQAPYVHHKRTPDSPVRENAPDMVLVPGLAFTIEPILTMCKTDGLLAMGLDNFTIVAPGVPSSQWEHIVLITESGHEVLTRRPEEPADL